MLTVPEKVKDLLHLDTCKKNIRIHFPNGERKDICNNLIVLNTVSFKESLCSQETLKFGLCEAPVFECEVVGVGNIKGATIEVSCEVYCETQIAGAKWQADLQAWVYPIPYGVFYVDSCRRQGDIQHRKIVAYGGQATYSWGPSAIETLKYKNNISSGKYSPSIFFFLNACGIRFDDSYFNIEELTYNLTTYIPNKQKNFGEYTVIVNYYGYSFGLVPVVPSIVEMNEFIYNRSETFESELLSWLWDYYSIEEANEVYDYFFADKDHKIGEMRAKISSSVDYGYFYCDSGVYNYIYPYINSSSRIAQCIFLCAYTIDLLKNGLPYASSQIIYRADTPRVWRKMAPVDKIQEYMNETISFDVVGNYVDYSKLNTQNLCGAWFERQGLFGNFDRNNILNGVNIKRQFGLVPGQAVYPNVTLYPRETTGGRLRPSDYQTCWYDDAYTQRFGAIDCRYKNTNNEDAEFILYLTGYDADTITSEYQIYDISDNELIKGRLWTQTQIQDICNAIAANIDGVSYIPVDFKGRGLPYVEAGDTFEILTKSGDSITTIVLNKTTTGEQTLTDNYKSNGTGAAGSY